MATDMKIMIANVMTALASNDEFLTHMEAFLSGMKSGDAAPVATPKKTAKKTTKKDDDAPPPAPTKPKLTAEEKKAAAAAAKEAKKAEEAAKKAAMTPEEKKAEAAAKKAATAAKKAAKDVPLPPSPASGEPAIGEVVDLTGEELADYTIRGVKYVATDDGKVYESSVADNGDEIFTKRGHVGQGEFADMKVPA